MNTYYHQTVLLDEAINGLNIRSDGIYIDGTFGRGGHSRLILSKLNENGRLIAIDRDPEAVAEAQKITDTRFVIIHGVFSELLTYLKPLNLVNKVDGVLLDLGVSSPQLDDPSRGFSFMRNGALDMRMDPSQGISAAEWLKRADEKDIITVLKEYGEERFAKRIAHAIVARRLVKPITETHELAELVTEALPIKEKTKHPATRTFQAIRIFINKELEQIHHGLEVALSCLSSQGRLCVISFHSLEDRIVKSFIRQHSQGKELPAGLPLTEVQLRAYAGANQLKKIARIKPSAIELKRNPRARSSVLRIAEKRAI